MSTMGDVTFTSSSSSPGPHFGDAPKRKRPQRNQKRVQDLHPALQEKIMILYKMHENKRIQYCMQEQARLELKAGLEQIAREIRASTDCAGYDLILPNNEKMRFLSVGQQEQEGKRNRIGYSAAHIAQTLREYLQKEKLPDMQINKFIEGFFSHLTLKRRIRKPKKVKTPRPISETYLMPSFKKRKSEDGTSKRPKN